jgi:hypothetical protein
MEVRWKSTLKDRVNIAQIRSKIKRGRPMDKRNTEGTENSEGHRGKMFFRYGGKQR